MEYLKLLGILVVILGFALKFNSILIIIVAMITTGLLGGLSPLELLSVIGETFVANRAMAIFILIMLVTGTLERNGLKTAASNLIGKFKSATPGKIIGIYGVMRGIFGAFNVGFGGVAGFVRPIIMPMAQGAIETTEGHVDELYLDKVKGMASGMENIIWFFTQVLFVGGSGALLVQGTLKSLGYEVELIELAKVEIPVALFAVIFTVGYYILRDNRLRKKFYGVKNREVA